MNGQQQLYTLQEVCALLSLSETSVRRLVRDGHLAGGRKIPGQACVRWFRLDVEAFLDRLRHAPPASAEEEG